MKRGVSVQLYSSNYSNLWIRLKEKKLLLIALFTIVTLSILAIIGPYLTPFTYSEQILTLKNKPPGYDFYLKYNKNNNGTINIIEVSEEPIENAAGFKVEKRIFLFGSDALGRDLFTRIWYGARISLSIGLATAFIVFIIGSIYGGLSGYYGGWIDEVMMRIVEVLNSIPFLLYVILLMLIFEPGLKTILFAIGGVYWLPMARMIRGQVITLKEQDYVLAALSLGASSWRILFKHILPNSLGPILVYTTLTIPEAIFTEAWLSFLGMGVSVPIASWGSLINDGIEGMRSYPWQLFFPSFLITITMLAFNIIGDSLRDAFDPRFKRK
ncbi:MAG: oligopeptide transport system permease protein [Clostridia bacterium]|jgi:oligopeptide transport system permease protein|nr:oligopeptide transport system permease protein [Clostridia bacterium]